eukprot:jgi/Galph1/445/GphlegSOOS_G5271.1
MQFFDDKSQGEQHLREQPLAFSDSSNRYQFSEDDMVSQRRSETSFTEILENPLPPESHREPDEYTEPPRNSKEVATVYVCEFNDDYYHETCPEDISLYLSLMKNTVRSFRWMHTVLPDTYDSSYPTVDGVLKILSVAYNIHPLAVEDICFSSPRPKFDRYGSMLFIVAHLPVLLPKDDSNELFLKGFYIVILEQRGVMLTFEKKHPGSLISWVSAVRERFASNEDNIESRNLSLVLYYLLDILTDSFFPVLEYYGEQLEEIESNLMLGRHPNLIKRISLLKRDIFNLRRNSWPLREILNKINSLPQIDSNKKPYFRDCLDHLVQIIDILEVYRDSSLGLVDLYLSGASNDMQEVMKTLTIISTIFIPLSFLASIYGMNFSRMPELHYSHSYTVFWIVVIAIVGFELLIFRRRGWIDRVQRFS